jgi:hypothetical protein
MMVIALEVVARPPPQQNSSPRMTVELKSSSKSKAVKYLKLSRYALCGPKRSMDLLMSLSYDP